MTINWNVFSLSNDFLSLTHEVTPSYSRIISMIFIDEWRRAERASEHCQSATKSQLISIDSISLSSRLSFHRFSFFIFLCACWVSRAESTQNDKITFTPFHYPTDCRNITSWVYSYYTWESGRSSIEIGQIIECGCNSTWFVVMNTHHYLIGEGERHLHSLHSFEQR